MGAPENVEIMPIGVIECPALRCVPGVHDFLRAASKKSRMPA
jgi:hypothetical protein